jgi:hypothetical protein
MWRFGGIEIMRLIEKIKKFRLTKRNFAFVIAAVVVVILFVVAAITDGILYAIAILVGLALIIAILAKLLPWIESKLPEE